jgi:hypothetical protein
MAQILAGVKAQGQTAASAAIATVVVNYNSDGSWDFTDAQSNKIIYSGHDAAVNKLLELMFIGTGGLPTGTKLFGNT